MLRGFLLIQFVFYVLFDEVAVGAEDAAAVDEDRGGGGGVVGQAVCVAGFGAGETGLEGVGIQADLRGVVGQLGVGIFGRDDVLIVVNEVVKLPEGLGLLVIGAAASYGGTAGPGMLLEREILEHQAHLGIVDQEALKHVVEAPADRALEVGELHHGNSGLGVAPNGRVLDLELGTILCHGVL